MSSNTVVCRCNSTGTTLVTIGTLAFGIYTWCEVDYLRKGMEATRIRVNELYDEKEIKNHRNYIYDDSF